MRQTETLSSRQSTAIVYSVEDFDRKQWRKQKGRNGPMVSAAADWDVAIDSVRPREEEETPPRAFQSKTADDGWSSDGEQNCQASRRNPRARRRRRRRLRIRLEWIRRYILEDALEGPNRAPISWNGSYSSLPHDELVSMHQPHSQSGHEKALRKLRVATR